MIQWRWQVKKMTIEIYLAVGRHKRSPWKTFFGLCGIRERNNGGPAQPVR
jgi:hypothetical protein